MCLRLWVEHSWYISKLLEMSCSRKAVTTVVSWSANDEHISLAILFSDALVVVIATLCYTKSRKFHELERVEMAGIWHRSISTHQVHIK